MEQKVSPAIQTAQNEPARFKKHDTILCGPAEQRPVTVVTTRPAPGAALHLIHNPQPLRGARAAERQKEMPLRELCGRRVNSDLVEASPLHAGVGHRARASEKPLHGLVR